MKVHRKRRKMREEIYREIELLKKWREEREKLSKNVEEKWRELERKRITEWQSSYGIFLFKNISFSLKLNDLLDN